VSIARDAATGAVNQIVINTAPPAVNKILAVEPTPDAPSGLVARVDAVTNNGNGTTTLAVTPGTPADAYASGTVKAVDTAALAATTLTPAAATPNGTAGPLFARNLTTTGMSPSVTVPAPSPLKCDGGVTSDLHGLSVDPALSSEVTAIWKHPLFSVGGFYPGTGGLSVFQYGTDGTITVNLGVAVSGTSTCTLTLPKVKTIVPAGALGAVITTVTPTLTLNVTGKVDLRTSVTLACTTEYLWENGAEIMQGGYCSAKHQPLQLSADSGADVTLTGALDARVTLDEIAGITGNITAAAHAGYHPAGSPVAQIDAKSTYTIGACLACFWKGSPAHVTMVDKVLFDKVLFTSDTTPAPTPTPTPTPLAVTTTTLPDAVVNQPYTATLAADGGTAPFTWSIATGSPPPGLSLSEAGTITGTPTTPGTASFTVTVHDSTGATATAPLSLDVGGAGAIRAGSISAGINHTCAVTTGGAAKCWGDNQYGELGVGDGTTTQSTTPVDVVGLGSGVASVSAGINHTCAVTTGGAVKCWGYNVVGELGDGTTTQSNTPVDVVGLGSGVASVSAGGNHTCAVTIGGAAKCWGYNGFGELGDGTTTQSSTPVDVVGLGSSVASVSAGGNHTCAVTIGGAVKCWGDNSSGELGDGTTTYSATPVDVVGLGLASVSDGYQNTCAVTTSGAAKCWGNNVSAELGDGTTTNSSTPVDVVGLGSGVATVSAGYHSCAVTTAGAAKCWGNNVSAELGDGTTTYSSTPVGVVGLGSGVATVSAGYHHTCAVTTGGAAKCWGDNLDGALGDGTNTESDTPVAVVGLP